MTADEGSNPLHTRSADVELTALGIVHVRIRPDVDQTVQDAQENLQACHQMAAGRRPGLLLDLSQALPLEAEVRHVYRGYRVDGAFAALAVVVRNSPLGRMMGNVYLRVANLATPTRLFSDPAEAVTWLQSVHHV